MLIIICLRNVRSQSNSNIFIGMISYRVFRNESLMFVKIIYTCLQVAAFIFGIMGLSAVLKYYDQQKLKPFHTLHSWIGIVLVTLFGFQVIFHVSIKKQKNI